MATTPADGVGCDEIECSSLLVVIYRDSPDGAASSALSRVFL